MDATELLPLTDPLLELAGQAGQAIMEVYGRPDFAVQVKDDRSPLTEADLAANKVLMDGLAGMLPGVPILSEESREIPWEERCNWQRFWLVDPLDGTKEFVKRNGEFTVNVALIENGRPLLGVVHAPVLNESYWGGPAIGSYLQVLGKDRRGIRVAPDPAAGDPLLVVASRSHRSPELESYLDKLGEHECVAMGSSLKLCLVAAGRAHHYPRIGPTMEWDTAAAHALVLGAGGSVVNLQGEELRYNKENLLNPYFLVRNHP